MSYFAYREKKLSQVIDVRRYHADSKNNCIRKLYGQHKWTHYDTENNF